MIPITSLHEKSRALLHGIGARAETLASFYSRLGPSLAGRVPEGTLGLGGLILRKNPDGDDCLVKRLKIEAEPAKIEYDLAFALARGRAAAVVKLLDFRPDFRLARLGKDGKVLEHQLLGKEARGKEFRFEAEVEDGKRHFRFCLFPRFGYAYSDLKLLADDVVCDELVQGGTGMVKEELVTELFKLSAGDAVERPAPKSEAEPASRPVPEDKAPASEKPAAESEKPAKPQTVKPEAGAKPGEVALLKQGKFLRLSFRSDSDPGQDTIYLDDRDVGATPTADQAVFSAREVPLKISYVRGGQRKWKSYTLAFSGEKLKICHMNKCEEYPMSYLDKGLVWLYVKEDRKAEFRLVKE